MTRAPETLLDVRRLLLDHLDIDPGKARSIDLESDEVGIVGDSAHRGGYHCGRDRVDADDYSVDESPRDAAGLTLDAAALDVGMFEVRSGGRTYDLPHFSAWCVAQCVANTPDSRDIREIIWSPDGRTVRRWDRLRRRSSGDASHRWHTHFSFFRDAIKARRDQTPLFRRYLTTIGLLEDDMALTAEERAKLNAIHTDLRKILTGDLGDDNAVLWWIRSLANRDDPLLRSEYPKWPTMAGPGLAQLGAQLAALRTDLAALAGRDVVDEQQVAADLAPALLAVLTPQAIAAAIPTDIAGQVADELAGRLGQARE